MAKPLINIITRTSNRPNGFRINVESVRSQTYKNVRHFVCTDDKNSVPYIVANGILQCYLIDKEAVIRKDTSVDPNTGPYFPYNLYFNEVTKFITEGWILYLDDDDRFVDETCLEQIADLIQQTDEDTLIYWRMVYSTGNYLPLDMSDGKAPTLGGIGGSCFIFHSKYKDRAIWDGWKCADYRLITKLHNLIPKKKWYPKNLIYVPSAGEGRKIDLQPKKSLNMIFKDSKLAHDYLDGLKGIEIGGSAHNPYNLNTINVDKKLSQVYIDEQTKMCGKVMNVDVEITNPAKLPFKDNEYDFVLASHVIEHIYRPDLAIIEWARVASKYVFLVIPHKERIFDKHRPETTPEEIFSRDNPETYPDLHHNVWKPESFLKLMDHLKDYVEVVKVQDPDDKVGNGFTVVLKTIKNDA